MVKNNIGVIVLVSAIVAVVTSIVTGLIVANVNLSPPKTISDASGIINAHKCMADGICEVNELESVGAISGEDVNVDEVVRIYRPDGSYWAIGKREDSNDFAISDNLNIPNDNVFVIHQPTGAVKINNLKNLDTPGVSAYVCVDFKGNLFRSATPCV